MAARQPAFVLHTGDLTTGGTTVEYDTDLFAVYRDLMSFAPLYPAAGDGELQVDPPAPYLQAFFLPQNGPPGLAERVYSLDWGSAHVVALDTSAPFDAGSAQHAWLAADLAASQQPWKFVTLHDPPYSSGLHRAAISRCARRWAPCSSRAAWMSSSPATTTTTSAPCRCGKSSLRSLARGASSTSWPAVAARPSTASAAASGRLSVRPGTASSQPICEAAASPSPPSTKLVSRSMRSRWTSVLWRGRRSTHPGLANTRANTQVRKLSI